MLAPLDNETIFKRAFTDKVVFEQFVLDIFGVEVTVDTIETEKQFEPKASLIGFKIDIYAETIDKRFIIEIQRIDYDHNFDRFLHYFLTVITEQQRKASEYKIGQQVLAVIVLTRPYVIDQRNGEPILADVMSLDINPRDLQNQIVELWGHRLVFLNPHPSYRNENTPPNYRDWIDLIYFSIKHPKNFKININNKGIAKVTELIEFENLDPTTLQSMKIAQSKKATIKAIEEKSRQEGEKKGIKKGKKIGIEEGKKIGIEKGEKIGIEKGEKIGELRTKIKTSIEMLKENMNDSLVQKFTSLTLQQISKIHRLLNENPDITVNEVIEKITDLHH